MESTAVAGGRERWNGSFASVPEETWHLFPMVLLNARGMILECNAAFETLFGMAWASLGWQHISMLFPELDADDFALAGKTYPMQDYLIRCGQLHRGRNRQGEMFSCNLVFAPALHEGDHCLRLTVIPSAARHLS
jgi:PAS domain S-box-containing protein